MPSHAKAVPNAHSDSSGKKNWSKLISASRAAGLDHSTFCTSMASLRGKCSTSNFTELDVTTTSEVSANEERGRRLSTRRKTASRL